jgi:hypothetical protein
LLERFAIFVNVFVAMFPLGVSKMVDCFEDFGEQAVRAFAGTLRSEVLGQVGAPQCRWNTFYHGLPSNQVLGVDEM